MKRLSLVLVLLFSAVPLAAQNNCGNVYWANSLRCQIAGAAAIPQPNIATPPAVAADVKPFTRVFLMQDLSVRCLDGTRPVIYVDEAVSGNSNDWIISFTGGGGTHPLDTNADGIPDDAQDAVDTYLTPSEADEMGTSAKPAMKTLNGINSADAVLNPVFSDYNRVRVEKCSYDRFMGRTSWVAAGGFYAGLNGAAAINFNLYQQGALIIREALEALGPGLAYTSWTVDAAGAVVATNEQLPPLVDADKVLFVGHSGGAHGLYHNIDNIAAGLAAVPGFAGDVRALFDANFLPSLENEIAFDSVNPGVDDVYDQVTTGTTVATNNTFTYDGAAHYPTAYIKEQADTWGAILDTSCMTAHAAAGDDWKCIDRGHVMLNHIATPFMFREDFSDPNMEHLNGGSEHTVYWGDEDFYAHCPVGTQCLPILDAAEFRDRLEEQFQAMLDYSQTDSELATGADPSLGAGNFPTFYAWMPDCGTHAGAYDNDSFFDTDMSYLAFTYNMNVWLQHFLNVGRTNLRGWRVDGWTSAGNTMTTTCP